MLREIVAFEWRYHSRQVAFAAASLLFLALGFMLGVSKFGPDNVAVNSPFLVMEAFGLLSLVALVPAAIFASSAVLRDDEYRMTEIVHSTPIGRVPYLAGRFSGAFLATLTTFSFSAIGMFAASLMPWLEPQRVGPVDARPWLAAFAVITVPTVLFVAALLFAVAVLTRNAVATYSTAIALYILYFVSAALTESPLMAASKPGGGGGAIASILDPLGLTSFFAVTRLWTAFDKNTRLVPVESVFLANRLVWIAAAFALLAVVGKVFRFTIRRTSGRRIEAASTTAQNRVEPLPTVRVEKTSWPSAWWSATTIELRMLANRSTSLLLLLWTALAFTEIRGDVLTREYQSISYPATGLVIGALGSPVKLIGIILIVYFAAEIFWREQQYRVAPIIDSTQVPASVLVAAKWAALATLIAAVLLGGAFAGLALQLTNGYSHVQPLLYLSFFYFSGVPLLLYAAAALFIHSLSPGKYAGMILFAAFVIAIRQADSLGLEHDLWQFASAPPVGHTELNGFGHAAWPFHWFMLHWTVLALVMTSATAMLWRHTMLSSSERLRFLLRPSRTIRALLLAFIASGGWIFYNANIAHAYVPADELFDWKADYEKEYKRIETLPRPAIAAVETRVDLDPRHQKVRVAGRYALVNRTNHPIASVFVATRRGGQVDRLSIRNARLVRKDERFDMYEFAFEPPLVPHGKAELQFDLSFKSDGFASGQQDESVIENGTWLMSFRAFPTLGYRRSYELSLPRERQKRGLAGTGTAVLGEDGAHGAIEGSEEEWVAFEATISTAADQIALAPGRLIASGRDHGRRWFHYRSDAPILNRFAIASARYAVAKRQHGDVSIEVYYHPTHAVNVAHMLDTAAATLDVMQTRFGRYPYGELRIIEVASHWPMAGFALPGSVYLREDRAFLTDRRDEARPDLVARRVAHEVAHQWFGHRLHAPNVEGSSVLVESLTKYAELLVIEQMHGKAAVTQLLDLELDRYLAGRAAEASAEVPLFRTTDQQYLYYSKGAIVFSAMRSLLGEDRVNEAIRNLMREPRPTTVSLIRHLETTASPAQKQLIDEWMKEIVLYDLEIDDAQVTQRTDGNYDVSIDLHAGKVRADGQGKEQQIELAEPIEIALTAGDVVLQSSQHPIHSGANRIRIVTSTRPDSVILDPATTRLDRNTRDNVHIFGTNERSP